ncbi:Glutaminase [Croceitalea dokdonensis DOKDO 023]|uniref:Glutaminase n=1 Tax=Croceitalea dokdonensis DOKDO 023 TaxID=1300341 RepID=A0A0P7AEC8_9FLAO|nr:glutaminase [Croceitalea dokdonensis]KPM30579.1 Glutaminase [Croceitalea dokdonensis DOKDO 023]
MTDFNKILDQVYKETLANADTGKVARYIPELAKISNDKFGLCLLDAKGSRVAYGDWEERFSIQSISKVFGLALAFKRIGNKLWSRVGVEPSGDPFNHLSLLELEQGIPRNPLINAGAIVVCDILVSEFKDAKKEVLQFVRSLTNDDSIDFNFSVAASEKATGFKNYAAAYLMKSNGNLNNPVETVLDLYFHLCALEMSCSQVATAFFPFMNHGRCTQNIQHLEVNKIKRINAIMLTCGFYDEAGEFAFEVGLPGKSGVGGGIVALLPQQFCIVSWSPGLNPKGNSTRGMYALERFTTLSELSIF